MAATQTQTPTLTVIKAIIRRLDAYSPLTDIVGQRIYDEPPNNVQYPYVRIGRIQVQQDDTDGSAGAKVMASVEAHSRPSSGRIQCQMIIDAVRLALHRQEAALNADGLYAIDYVDENVERDAAGETYVGVISFEILADCGLFA